MLQISELSKTISGRKILDNIHFSLEEGDMLALAGANGAGKSTLMKIITGILRQDSGSLTFRGKPLTQILPKTSIAYTSQDIILYEDLSIYENLCLFGRGLCTDKSRFEETLRSLSERLSLTSRLHQRVSSLSGGQKRRVHIAASLFGEPQLLLLDEPIAGIDAGTAKDVEALVLHYRNRGVTGILTSHTADFLAATCNKLLLLEKGTAVYFGDFDPDILSGIEEDSYE